MRTYIFLLTLHDRQNDAIRELSKHIQTYAADVEALLELAHLHTSQSSSDKASYLYEQLILLQPWQIGFYVDYAKVRHFENLP